MRDIHKKNRWIDLGILMWLGFAAIWVLWSFWQIQPRKDLVAWSWPAVKDALVWAAGACLAALGLREIWRSTSRVAAQSTQMRRTNIDGRNAWRGQSTYVLGACLVMVYFAFGLGWAQSLSAIWLLLCLIWIGFLLMSTWLSRSQLARTPISMAWLLGCLAALLTAGALMHWPVNSGAVYFTLLSLPWLFGLRASIRRKAGGALALRMRRLAFSAGHWFDELGFWRAVALAVVLGWVLRLGFFPTLGFDDHAYHLRLWTELSTFGQSRFDLNAQIWASAPFAHDLFHSLISLMAGADARGVMNVLLVLLILRQLVALVAAMGLAVRDQWLIAMAFLSTPMLGNLMLQLQTELFLALSAMLGARCVWLLACARNSQQGAVAWAGVVCAASLCVATKLPGVVLAALLLAAACAQKGSLRCLLGLRGRCWAGLLVLLFAAFLVAIHSYAYAWWLSGNPVFPVYNAVFKSPLHEAINLVDPRYQVSGGLLNLLAVFAQTSRFFESRNFVAGWQYLLLFIPACFVLICAGFGAWRVTSGSSGDVATGAGVSKVAGFGTGMCPSNERAWLALCAVCVGFVVVMFGAVQYWRYVFPILPLACVVIAVLFVYLPLFGFSSASHGSLKWVRLALWVGFALNVWFYTGISWILQSPASQALSSKGREQLAAKYAPATLLTAYLNSQHPRSRVLYPEYKPSGGSLIGLPILTNWHSPARRDVFNKIRDRDAMGRWLRSEAIDFVVFHGDEAVAYSSAMWWLRDWLSVYALPIKNVGDVVLYRIVDRPVSYQTVYEADLKWPQALHEATQVVAEIKLGRQSALLYQAKISCEETTGFFIAQLNWKRAPPFYRKVPCVKGDVLFSESLSIPKSETLGGQASGEVYATADGGAKINGVVITLKVK